MSDQSCVTPRRPRFDATINLGDMLVVAGFILAAGASYYGVKSEIQGVEYRITAMEKTAERLSANIDKLTTITIVTARQDEQIAAIVRRLELLERRPRRRKKNSRGGAMKARATTAQKPPQTRRRATAKRLILLPAGITENHGVGGSIPSLGTIKYL
jgi:hypothetical protein